MFCFYELIAAEQRVSATMRK